MTAAVLPLNALIMAVLYTRQRRTFVTVGLRFRRPGVGLLAYFLLYQLLLSPVSLTGYIAELVRAPRRW